MGAPPACRGSRGPGRRQKPEHSAELRAWRGAHALERSPRAATASGVARRGGDVREKPLARRSGLAQTAVLLRLFSVSPHLLTRAGSTRTKREPSEVGPGLRRASRTPAPGVQRSAGAWRRTDQKLVTSWPPTTWRGRRALPRGIGQRGVSGGIDPERGPAQGPDQEDSHQPAARFEAEEARGPPQRTGRHHVVQKDVPQRPRAQEISRVGGVGQSQRANHRCQGNIARA